jgi:hypothetical protein
MMATVTESVVIAARDVHKGYWIAPLHVLPGRKIAINSKILATAKKASYTADRAINRNRDYRIA